MAGKPGYVAIKDKDGKFVRWSQPPGPSNALGQLKFVMYNPYNIYLHDTNARSRFNSQVRALVHGCVRTENVLDLATELLGDDGGEWTPDEDRRDAGHEEVEAGQFRQAAAGLHRLFQRRRADRRHDRRLSGPLQARHQGDRRLARPRRQAGAAGGRAKKARALEAKPRRLSLEGAERSVDD